MIFTPGLRTPGAILVQPLMRHSLMHTRGSWWCCMIPGWLIRANQIGLLTLPSRWETLCTWQKRHDTLGENRAAELALTFWVICSLMGKMLLHSVDIHVTSWGGSFAVMDTHGTAPISIQIIQICAYVMHRRSMFKFWERICGAT